MSDPLTNGTLGVLLTTKEETHWETVLVFAHVLCVQDYLPEEDENLLSVILLPV